jgi:hypothetical protein
MSEWNKGTGNYRTHLHAGSLVEAVHLVEKLEQDTLHLPVGTHLSIEALGRNGIHLVDEDYRRRVLLGQSEDVPHHARS